MPDEKSSTSAGRMRPTMVDQAKKPTGMEVDADLIEFARPNVALVDDFAETFKAARGKVDAMLKLGF